MNLTEKQKKVISRMRQGEKLVCNLAGWYFVGHRHEHIHNSTACGLRHKGIIEGTNTGGFSASYELTTLGTTIDIK